MGSLPCSVPPDPSPSWEGVGGGQRAAQCTGGREQGWTGMGQGVEAVAGLGCGSYLVLAALAALQAGQDLAFDGLHPGVPLLKAAGLEVPRLPRAGHDEELEVLLLCWTRGGGDTSAPTELGWGRMRWKSPRGVWGGGYSNRSRLQSPTQAWMSTPPPRLCLHLPPATPSVCPSGHGGAGHAGGLARGARPLPVL